MLGFYESFPVNIHKITQFVTSLSNKRLQQKLIQTLREMNSKVFNLEEVATPLIPHCNMTFEFGVADANNFNYLDDEEAERLTKAIRKKPLHIMDFFCALCYYKMQNEKKRPLKFDYYIIRFKFNRKPFEMQFFHDRGPRYVSPEDITNFITNKINEARSKKVLKVSKA